MPADADALAPPAALREALFAPGAAAYAVADGAAREGFVTALFEAGAPPAPLLPGALDDAALAMAPHLVALRPDAPALALLEEGWGRAEAVWLRSPLGPTELRRALTRAAEARLPRGRALFRFYDPRVMRAALPALSTANRAALFAGAVEVFLCEDETGGNVLRFEP